MSFSEDFLHYLWKLRLFNQRALKTVSGEPLEIVDPGLHNKDAGPDFEHARIRIGETLWAGNVELHLHSSDWDKHQHSGDLAYNNVILHVVHIHDRAVFRNDGTEIQTLDLQKLIPAEIEFRYQNLMKNMNWIPCEKHIAGVSNLHIRTWLIRILAERLEDKSTVLRDIIEAYKGSWDDAFYVMLARNFGFKTNALPFELLARSLPQQILARHKNNSLQIEALIFGHAGFLKGRLHDQYARKLQKEYNYLMNKYHFKPIDQFIWKFLRLRPQNFPTMRLAQFAALILKSNHLFSKVIEIKDVKIIREMFSALPVNNYWKTHFRFDKETNMMSAQIGEEAVNNILLNTVALFLYSYGKHINDAGYINRSLALLESLPAEINQVTRRFTRIGVEADKGDLSQALLQLKKYYCDQKKCLNCGIGIQLLTKN